MEIIRDYFIPVRSLEDLKEKERLENIKRRFNKLNKIKSNIV